MHYQRIKRHGAPGDAERKRVAKYAPDAVCDVIGCDKRVKVNGLCWMHDQRRRTSGDVGDAAPRRRRNGTGTRYKTPEGYVIVGPSDAKRLEHRVVMEGILGRPLRDYENVHHLNGVKHDNRPENLELWVTRQIKGQRLEDLLSWVVDNYPEAVRAALDERTQLRLAI